MRSTSGACISDSIRWVPMKPDPPVTATIFGMFKSGIAGQTDPRGVYPRSEYVHDRIGLTTARLPTGTNVGLQVPRVSVILVFDPAQSENCTDQDLDIQPQAL